MEINKAVRVGVVGAGSFGKNHLRVLSQLPGVRLVAVVEADPARRNAAAEQYGCAALEDPRDLVGLAEAAIVATPTTSHAAVAVPLLQAGLDVLVEKPIAGSMEEARLMVDAAAAGGRILQVGHLERFNPAVEALEGLKTHPLFFEIHRMSLFTPRSLDVDVVLDLMIHDLEIVLALTGSMPEEIRAAGLSILSSQSDIANVRLQFPGGCVANLTASRASTEQVRKLRLFAPHQYVSLDYSKQQMMVIQVGDDRQIRLQPTAITKDEPLRRELEHFIACINTRQAPRVSGVEAMRALEVAIGILDKIREHAEVVAGSLAAR
ncbi:MAG: Gfo/Idh/MocA family oxidoreductase [Acidobacteria bacterium]|nr:Gfo/Idh/MocA family oxidoreductase [Acidobacteriota bacterium]